VRSQKPYPCWIATSREDEVLHRGHPKPGRPSFWIWARGAPSAYKIFSLPVVARLECSSPRRVLSRSGSARLGRSQKDGLPFPLAGIVIEGFKAIHSRKGGAAWLAAPLNRERDRLVT
jgi:hypothetical protein